MIQNRFKGKVPDFPGFPDITTMRELMAKSKRAMTEHHGGARTDDICEEEHLMTTRDGARVKCRTYTPTWDYAGGRGVYVVFHGGGFCLGDLSNEELLCRLLSKHLDIVCVNVEYRLAPEHPFPTAPNDCFEATRWVCHSVTRKAYI